MRHTIVCTWLLIAAAGAAGCDIIGGLGAKESETWHKTYSAGSSPSVSIRDHNGKIVVETGSSDSVDVTAVKTASGATPDAAKANLQRISIDEKSASSSVTLDTNITGTSLTGALQVEYHVTLPAGSTLRAVTDNGGIEVDGVQGAATIETTNGTVKATHLGGAVEASTTNGTVTVDVTRLVDGGVRLSCTNGTIRLTLPPDGKATIEADVTNGGVSFDNLAIQTSNSSRRHLEGTLNGGGPKVNLETTNGGITISGR